MAKDIDLDTAAPKLQAQLDEVLALVERAAQGDVSDVERYTLEAKFSSLTASNTSMIIALLEERAAAHDTP